MHLAAARDNPAWRDKTSYWGGEVMLDRVTGMQVFARVAGLGSQGLYRANVAVASSAVGKYFRLEGSGHVS